MHYHSMSFYLSLMNNQKKSDPDLVMQEHLFIMALFSNFVTFREKKTNCHCFHVDLAFDFFEKEEPKLNSNAQNSSLTLKLAFGF